MSYVILDFFIYIFSYLDFLIQSSFGKFMPDFLAFFSFTLLTYSIGAYCDRKHHPFIKIAIYIITGLYSLYKIYIYQIAASLDTLSTIFMVFLFIIYPIGLLFTASYFKNWKIGDWHIFNYHTFWLIFIACVFWVYFTDPLAVSLEFCLIYIVASYAFVFVIGHVEEV